MYTIYYFRPKTFSCSIKLTKISHDLTKLTVSTCSFQQKPDIQDLLLLTIKYIFWDLRWIILILTVIDKYAVQIPLISLSFPIIINKVVLECYQWWDFSSKCLKYQARPKYTPSCLVIIKRRYIPAQNQNDFFPCFHYGPCIY